MSETQGRTLWEMVGNRNKVVERAAQVPLELKPDFFNPLGLHIGDIARVSDGVTKVRFQIVEVDVFDRGAAGKTVDYRLYKKAGDNQPEVERYLRVFPGTRPDGKATFELLLLENVASVGFDQGLLDLLTKNEFPMSGYDGFERNNGVTVPYEASVTEIKGAGETSHRRIKYWDFVRSAGDSFEAFFVEMDSESGSFDGYFAKPVAAEGLEFLRKK